MKKISTFVVILLVAGASVGAEWIECAGWLSSAQARHACCAKKIAKVSQDASGRCCAMSQQSRNNGPTETRAIASAPTVIRSSAPAVPDFLATATPALIDGPSTRPHTSPVPLYVQHHSLLI